MARGGYGLWLALGAAFFAQAGVDVRAEQVVAGPSQGALPAAAATATPQASPAGGGGGAAASPTVDYGPMVLPIDGGDRRGVDAVGGASPSPRGGGGGGGPAPPMGDPDAPVQMGPFFLRFDPPVDRRGDPGPAGTSEPMLAPGSPLPRR